MGKYLVTGASRGIGMATTKTLLQDGHQVYGTYNTGREAAEALKKSNSGLEIFQVNLADFKSIDTLVVHLGDIELDGIVNSAGIFEEVDFENFDISSLEKNFQVNSFAPVYLINKLMNRLKDASAIVNISSTDADVGSEAGMGYSASKAALSSLTKSLSQALAKRKIRVNAIAPGWIGDGMQSPAELLKVAEDYNPLQKLGSYEDIANLVAYLLSEKSAYINGTVVVADGGDSSKNYVLDQETKLL